MEQTHKGKRLSVLRRVDTLIGALLCGVAAVGISVVASGRPWQTYVPLMFVLVLLLVSVIFGTRAGILGTVLAALIFGGLLFHPRGSLQIANESARNNLAWMLLIGLFFSFLFAPPTSGLHRH